MGSILYGRIRSKRKKQYNRIADCIRRLQEYTRSGNDELLVDVGNICMIEFVEGTHPNKHFNSVDDGQHVKETI